MCPNVISIIHTHHVNHKLFIEIGCPNSGVRFVSFISRPSTKITNPEPIFHLSLLFVINKPVSSPNQFQELLDY
jgi:hypothetical protein